MYRLFIVLSGLAFTLNCEAQTDSVAQTRRLSELQVIGVRPLKLIGSTRSSIDSATLVESPTLNLGDLLSQSSAVFVKSYGRGTLATASFRGTSPAHTDIHWNGFRLNSPMLGQVDLSLVPSLFIDALSLWHGSSASSIGSGALGGAITLENTEPTVPGHHVDLRQTIGSFETLDSYLRHTYAGDRWSSSTRLYRASSSNDFPYRNFSKVNLRADGSVNNDEYETSYNRNSAYTDYHLLQDLYLSPGAGLYLDAHLWLLSSKRGVPMLQTDQRSEYQHRTEQREQTLRSVLRGRMLRTYHSLSGTVGFMSTHQQYQYTTQTAPTVFVDAINTSSYIRSLYGSFVWEYMPEAKWQVKSQLDNYYHHVDTWDRRTRTGYLGGRLEQSLLLSLRYRPTDRIGVGSNLRWEHFGGQLSPLSVTLLSDYLLLHRYGIRLRASLGTGHRFPTLNDLYYEPGGNPNLHPERSFSYDFGMEFALPSHERYALSGSVTLFDSYIKDWILWLPSYRGYWTPSNVRRVHNYGIELKAKASLQLQEVRLSGDLHWGYTRARNEGEPLGPLDESFSKQLPYIPRYQASLTSVLSWRAWQIIYKYNYYSTRYTTSSNYSTTAHSRLGAYHMSDLSIEWRHRIARMPFSIKGTIHNLLNEEYVSVLHRPMPRQHYTLSFALSPSQL